MEMRTTTPEKVDYFTLNYRNPALAPSIGPPESGSVTASPPGTPSAAGQRSAGSPGPAPRSSRPAPATSPTDRCWTAQRPRSARGPSSSRRRPDAARRPAPEERPRRRNERLRHGEGARCGSDHLALLVILGELFGEWHVRQVWMALGPLLDEDRREGWAPLEPVGSTHFDRFPRCANALDLATLDGQGDVRGAGVARNQLEVGVQRPTERGGEIVDVRPRPRRADDKLRPAR